MIFTDSYSYWKTLSLNSERQFSNISDSSDLFDAQAYILLSCAWAGTLIQKTETIKKKTSMNHSTTVMF